MKPILSLLGRYALTIGAVALAAVLALQLWHRYERTPWTRDGHVRADIIRVSTDVGGLVTQVMVQDNQTVTPGQLLIVLDRPRIDATIERADAAIAQARAELEQARRESRRDRALGDLVAAEAREQNAAKVSTLEAALKSALAARNVADVDRHRTEIRATVGGTITNLDIHPGDGLDDLLSAPSGAKLLTELRRDAAKPSDHVAELHALGLIASRDGARRSLEQLTCAGLLQADPRLDMLRLNAALDDQGEKP